MAASEGRNLDLGFKNPGEGVSPSGTYTAQGAGSEAAVESGEKDD